MRPFRIFVILVLLAGSALAVVYLRAASARTANHIQTLYGQHWEVRRQLWNQQAEIAAFCEPERIRKRVQSESIPVRPPRLPGVGSTPAGARHEWETD